MPAALSFAECSHQKSMLVPPAETSGLENFWLHEAS